MTTTRRHLYDSICMPTHQMSQHCSSMKLTVQTSPLCSGHNRALLISLKTRQICCPMVHIKLYSHDGCDHRRVSHMIRIPPHEKGEFQHSSRRIPTVIWTSAVSRITPHGPKEDCNNGWRSAQSTSSNRNLLRRVNYSSKKTPLFLHSTAHVSVFQPLIKWTASL